MKLLKNPKTKKQLFPYLLILPGVLVVGLILIYPLFKGIISSFYYQPPLAKTKAFIGLANYIKLFSDQIFIKSFSNSIVWTFTIVAAEYVIGLITALLFHEEFPGRNIYRSLILIPWVMPTIAAALTWKWIYEEQYGVLNHIFRSLGLISSNIAWLGSTKLAFPAVIIVAIWKGIPFVAVVLLAGLQNISSELYESASIEGANSWQRFWYITLPNLRGVSLITILLSCIWTFNQFDLVYIMTKGGPANSTQIIPVYTYLNAFNFFELNYATAIGTVGLAVMGVFAFFYMKILKMEEEQ